MFKKPSLDSNDFKNYRPISNLRFLSKTIEKCVAKQLIQYLDINNLGETYQSAYKRNHSTETALIRVHNDIALELLELYWNGFDHIFRIVHSLCRLMVCALLLMFLSLVYPRDPFLARCYCCEVF